MAPRQRKPSNRPLPPNTRERGGYYSWTSPVDGVEYGLGRDKRDAVAQAVEANMKISGTIVRPRLVDRLAGEDSRTLGKWLDEYEKILLNRKGKGGKALSRNTRNGFSSALKRARNVFDVNKPAAEVDTMDCAKVIDTIHDEGKARMAQSFRSFLHDCFRVAIQKGWRKDNPVSVTDRVSVVVKRARLEFPVFMAIYQSTQLIWLRNAMALALVSGQARESIIGSQVHDVHDGFWWNERGKTGAKIMLPLEALRLDCFGMSLDEVIRQCRRTGIVSRYLIHQTTRARGATLGKKINQHVITKAFTAEVRKLGLGWGEKNAPTFHEIRSLSERLYAAQGNVNTQELLGHRDAKMTSVYHDGRGEWVKVGIRK